MTQTKKITVTSSAQVIVDTTGADEADLKTVSLQSKTDFEVSVFIDERSDASRTSAGDGSASFTMKNGEQLTFGGFRGRLVVKFSTPNREGLIVAMIS